MTTETLKEKLQHTYQSMLETIEVLVNKEGKTIREAFDHAKEKLSEIEELSREEIQEISDTVKQDLQSFGDVLVEATDSYKEKMKFDLAYISDSLLDTFTKIADSSTAQLIEFKNKIEQEAREASMDEHTKEHREHQSWHSDHALWLDEISLWKKDHQTALDKLQQIEQAIKQHSNALDEHAQVIQFHEAEDKKHEQAMAETEKDPTSQVLEQQDEAEQTTHQQRPNLLHQ